MGLHLELEPSCYDPYYRITRDFDSIFQYSVRGNRSAREVSISRRQLVANAAIPSSRVSAYNIEPSVSKTEPFARHGSIMLRVRFAALSGEARSGCYGTTQDRD